MVIQISHLLRLSSRPPVVNVLSTISRHSFVTHLEEATALTRKLPSAQPRISYLWPFKALKAYLILQRDL